MIQIIASGIAVGSIYGLVALGLVLIFKATKIISFVHGQFIMIFTFMSLTLFNLGLPYPVVFLITCLFAAIVAYLVEGLLINPFISAPLMTTTILTLGLYLISSDVAIWIWGKDPQTFPSIFPTGTLNIGGAIISKADIGVILTTGLLSFALYLFFKLHKLGIAMKACADDQMAARLMGIPIKRVFSASWVIASIIGAIAGFLIAPITYVSVNMMQGTLMEALAAAVLGGISSLPGAMVGGIVLGILENISGFYVSANVKTALPFVLLILILIVKPNGLLGKVERKKV